MHLPWLWAVPCCSGASRKSFIGQLTGALADDRLPGSLAAALLAAAQGVQIVRVHDVAATRQALAVWEASCVRDREVYRIGEPGRAVEASQLTVFREA